MHAYHDGLENYDSRQIWYDGCEECEHRSHNLPDSIGQLDSNNLFRAIQRAKDWRNGKFDITGEISLAELPLLRLLRIFISIQEMLEREYRI